MKLTHTKEHGNLENKSATPTHEQCTNIFQGLTGCTPQQYSPAPEQSKSETHVLRQCSRASNSDVPHRGSMLVTSSSADATLHLRLALDERKRTIGRAKENLTMAIICVLFLMVALLYLISIIYDTDADADSTTTMTSLAHASSRRFSATLAFVLLS